MISESTFHRLAQDGHNRIALVLTTLADLETPLSAYVKLAHTARPPGWSGAPRWASRLQWGAVAVGTL